MSKPAFDPSQPFETLDADKPAFDPNAPFETADETKTEPRYRLGEAPYVPAGVEAFGHGAVADIPFGQKLVAAGSAGVLKLAKALGNSGIGPRYLKNLPDTSTTEQLARERELLARSHQEYPKSTFGGQLFGGGLSMAALSPFQAAEGAGALARYGAPMANAAAYGLAHGIGEGDTVGESLKRGAKEAVLTSTLAGLGHGAGELIGKAGKALVGGVVRPTPAARLLRARGIEPTLGQMAPESAIGQMEEASQSLSHNIGPTITAQRNAPRDVWQNAVISEAVPPGGSMPLEGTANEKLASIHNDFGNAYDAIKGAPVSERATARPVTARTLVKAMQRAVGDENVLATEADVDAANRFLKNQVSMVSRQDEGIATPDSLLQMRSNIRAQLRKLPSTDPKRDLLQNAEQQINSRLRYTLPADSLRSLESVDAKYGGYKTIENVLGRAGDQPNGFTPAQLSAAVKSTTGKGAYARGAGGPLRELASAGREVFDARVPPTGARILAAGPLQYVTGPAIAAANTKAIKPFLLGEAPQQQAIKALIESLTNNRAAKIAGNILSRSEGGIPAALGTTTNDQIPLLLSPAYASQDQSDPRIAALRGIRR